MRRRKLLSEEFERTVKDWLATARHPKFKRPYTDLVYRPMLELLAFLRANDFKTFIVSGGGIEFVRTFSEKDPNGFYKSTYSN